MSFIWLSFFYYICLYQDPIPVFLFQCKFQVPLSDFCNSHSQTQIQGPLPDLCQQTQLYFH
uniref:Uncharacterized protein n=1 Tax=Arundo donax TaxID=35708 RepID=A0A0A8ZER0_ARUDO